MFVPDGGSVSAFVICTSGRRRSGGKCLDFEYSFSEQTGTYIFEVQPNNIFLPIFRSLVFLLYEFDCLEYGTLALNSLSILVYRIKYLATFRLKIKINK